MKEMKRSEDINLEDEAPQSKRMSATIHSTVHLPVSPEAVNRMPEVTVESHVAADCAGLHECLRKHYI